MASGNVFTGCNIENASLGLTVCAERIALFNAVAHGTQEVHTLVVTSDHPEVDSPCGACRQVILELAPKARILFGDAEGIRKVWEAPRDLLPDAFDGGWNDPEQLRAFISASDIVTLTGRPSGTATTMITTASMQMLRMYPAVSTGVPA